VELGRYAPRLNWDIRSVYIYGCDFFSNIVSHISSPSSVSAHPTFAQFHKHIGLVGGNAFALPMHWVVMRWKLATIVKHDAKLSVLELYHLAVAVAAILILK
jgi:hypothetical protein